MMDQGGEASFSPFGQDRPTFEGKKLEKKAASGRLAHGTLIAAKVTVLLHEPGDKDWRYVL
jgi:hypothetical protein